jgi:hypothetical protein
VSASQPFLVFDQEIVVLGVLAEESFATKRRKLRLNCISGGAVRWRIKPARKQITRRKKTRRASAQRVFSL